MTSFGVYGLFFLEGTMTGDKYLETLKNQIIPQLQQLTNLNDFYFQQDGAPPHHSRGVREYLDKKLSSALIGRRGPIDWPARSPNLTPMDFFFWGVLKDKVYSRKPRSVEELKNYIRVAFQEINTQSDLCKKICRSVGGRLQNCVNQERKTV